MDRRLQKFILVLITLALAIAPLRGALAIPESPVTDTESHCDQMQQPASAAHDCSQECDGTCCDDSCNACVPGTSAISGTLSLAADVTTPQHSKIIPVSFSGRTVIPPLRPPASL